MTHTVPLGFAVESHLILDLAEDIPLVAGMLLADRLNDGELENDVSSSWVILSGEGGSPCVELGEGLSSSELLEICCVGLPSSSADV